MFSGGMLNSKAWRLKRINTDLANTPLLFRKEISMGRIASAVIHKAFFGAILLQCVAAYGTPVPQVPPKVKETFSAILALEDMYHNEYLKYAPDLETLKKHFEVKDPIESLAPGFEIYAGTYDTLPFLYALDSNGDSLVQAGQKAIRFSKLNQEEYPIDYLRGIDGDNGLQVRLEFPKALSLKGEISKDSSVCRFTLERAADGKSNLTGCSGYLTTPQVASGMAVAATLPSGILLGKPWSLTIQPDSRVQVKGSYHSQADHPYPIRGILSPKRPFRIFTRAETRRK
jgi:hypothetical protein